MASSSINTDIEVEKPESFDESEYVLLNDEIEPDNELYKLSDLEQPLTASANRFIHVVSSAACLSTTDLKSRLRTIPHIIDTFYKNFEKLKSEAKNDPDRIQSEIFELYSSFFTLVKSILNTIDEAEHVLCLSDKSLSELSQSIRDKQVEAAKTSLNQLEQNGRAFKSLFDNNLTQNESRLAKAKLDISNMDKEFIDRLEKLKTEFSVMHPSPANSIGMSEWMKYAHILKVGTKLILPLWHVSYLLFFGVAFGASLVGLTEYFSYYKNHNGFVFLNACLSELYALQELSIVMSTFARSAVVDDDNGQMRDFIVELINDDEDKMRKEAESVINSTLEHSKEMIDVIKDLRKIDLKKFLI